MRISDWSSDVCSSDLNDVERTLERFGPIAALGSLAIEQPALVVDRDEHPQRGEKLGGGRRSLHQPAARAVSSSCVMRSRQIVSTIDRKSVVEGKGVAVSLGLGGRRNIKKKTLN